jgi:hypothetical protein
MISTEIFENAKVFEENQKKNGASYEKTDSYHFSLEIL